MTGGVTIAYSGVHQAYQLALAAAELRALDDFHCSLYGAPGKWGGWLEKFTGADALHNRRLAGLPPGRINEFPWPLLCQRARATLLPGQADDWHFANHWFDDEISRRLKKSPSQVFVGVETCAGQSFATARARAMTTLLDCPGIDARFLNRQAAQAAAEFGLPTPAQSDSNAMAEQKSVELALADRVLVGSEFQAQLLRQSGYAKPIHVLPLWADLDFWQPPSARRTSAGGPLRVLYAGKINLRKGLPYLIRAVAQSSDVELTLVGAVDRQLAPFLEANRSRFKLAAPCTKAQLRRHYHDHDILVLPSLGDAFGFVAMEAMACGLAAIVTDHCGVPVPDAAWRVPARNAEALAARLAIYAQDRELCHAHGQLAADFTRNFTPQVYRAHVKELLFQLLTDRQTPLAAPGLIGDDLARHNRNRFSEDLAPSTLRAQSSENRSE